QRPRGPDPLAQGADSAVQISGGGPGLHAAVGEANQVREIVVAEEARNLPIAQPHAERGIQSLRVRGHSCGVAPECDAKRPPENALIARKPSKAKFCGDAQSLV